MSRLMMPRAGPPLNRLVSAVWRAPSLLSVARWTGCVVAFWTEQVSGAGLHPGCPQGHRRRNSLRICNTAGGNDRDVHLPDDLRHEGKGAHLQCQVAG
jgi:hypothetical protein